MISASNPRNRESRQTICSIATQREHVFGALRLVHEQYVRSGLSLENQSGIRVTRYHLLNTTEILVGMVGGDVACTLSLVHDSRFGLPMEAIYRREVSVRRRLGKRVAEVSCLADRRSDSERTLNVMFRVMALVAQLATVRQIDELLIAVHPRHSRFYEGFLGFFGIGGLRYYSTVCGNPAVAMALDLTNLQETNPKVYQRLFGQPFTPEELKQRSIDLDLLEELSWIYLEDEEANRKALESRGVAAGPTPDGFVCFGGAACG